MWILKCVLLGAICGIVPPLMLLACTEQIPGPATLNDIERTKGIQEYVDSIKGRIIFFRSEGYCFAILPGQPGSLTYVPCRV